jgi:hypothetical protein
MKQNRHSEGLITSPIEQVGAGIKIGEVRRPAAREASLTCLAAAKQLAEADSAGNRKLGGALPAIFLQNEASLAEPPSSLARGR